MTRRPRHFIKRHRALSILIGIALLLLILLLIWLWILNNKLNQVPRFDADLGDDRPPYAMGTNILLVGVDDGKGVDLKEMLGAPEWRPGIFRSDAIMLVHISENWDNAQIISLPRDSYVPIEGYGTTKINAAFSYGGPSLLGRTVEDLTHTRIDHIFVADFEGFKGITEAIGGVRVYVPESAGTQNTVLGVGWQQIQGESALLYVRQRYGLPGGDFDRMHRQQNVLRSIADSAMTWNVLANPFRVTKLIEEITTHLAVDSSVSNRVLRSMLFSSRNLRLHDVQFATAPNDGSATIDGASIVKLRTGELRKLFAAISHDEYAAFLKRHEIDTLPPAAELR